MSYSSSALNLPLSPASPPESGFKQQSKQSVSAVEPSTPPSPPHMSVATKRYVSSYENSRHTDEMAQRSTHESYLPTSHRSSSNSNTTPQPNTLKRSLPQDAEERPASKRQRQEEREDEMNVDSSLKATNHDRNETEQEDGTPQIEVKIEHAAAASQELPGLSGRDKADLESMEKDIGSSFRLRSSTHNKAKIDMNEHILGKYGLSPLLATVARMDPDTNEKINKLRKSYEGQVRVAQLSGRNRPYKQERDPTDPDRSKLRIASVMPEEQFKETQVESKIGDLSALRQRMQRGLRLNPGTMNKSVTEDWDIVLGHDKRPVGQATPQQSFQQQPVSRIPNGVRPTRPAQPAPASAPATKPQTRGKKRSYHDSSFDGYIGYGDGYSDPEGHGTDNDRDFVDRGRKRRKE